MPCGYVYSSDPWHASAGCRCICHILREASASLLISTDPGNAKASTSGNEQTVQALTLFFCINHSNKNVAYRESMATLRKHMKYDIELIKFLLTNYIRQNIGNLTWIRDGKKVSVSKVESLAVLNVEEGDFGKGYNFHGSGRIQPWISSLGQEEVGTDSFFCICEHSFSCAFKVKCVELLNGKSEEEIDSIKDNIIILHKK